MPKPAQAAPRPVERMSVREWYECIQRIADRLTRDLPPKRARHRAVRPRLRATQLLLFKEDPEGENSPVRRQRGEDYGGMMLRVAKGAECG